MSGNLASIDDRGEVSVIPVQADDYEWSDTLTAYVEEILESAESKSSAHDRCGHHFHRLDVRWGIPSVCIPVILSPLSAIANSIYGPRECGDMLPGEYISSGGLLLTGLLAAYYGFFKFSARSANHFNFASKYADIASDIRTELCKPPHRRVSGDVFVTSIRGDVDNLCLNEPVIPEHLETTRG